MAQRIFRIALCTILVIWPSRHDVADCITKEEKSLLKEEAKEMFYHAYRSYMDHAYPADELMPLSCKGRYRDTEPNRGDIDDTLGNFSLTLVDALDTLVVLGDLDEFERGVHLVINDITFDNDVVVSVFETNIRMLGGLISSHILALYIQEKFNRLLWYQGEMLSMAKDLGYRLLPAFNTTTGVPHPRINLRHGLRSAKLGNVRETCTACAGTMILELAALSRLTGEFIFEEKAHQAMDYLWQQRHRSSDLMGTVLNIHSGDWIRRDSGVGAGIDSYYEYCLKAYILLGYDSYLERFNKHYSAVMKYVSQGPLLVDVHMHRPYTNSRNFMDALLAFWPGLQVLKGDIKPAIETHEVLYQVMQRHTFLPEAFTVDFQVHWGQHPLRPEFLESTYFLYKATGDNYYLEVGKNVLNSLQSYAKVPCGYAAVKDVRTRTHEDRMDSFVLAETFKYLYLLFAEKEDLIFDLDNFLFTTEAHLLPLSLARFTNMTVDLNPLSSFDEKDEFDHSCPNTLYLYPGNKDFAQSIRMPLKNLVEGICPKQRSPPRRLHAVDFQPNNREHAKLLRKMGITIMALSDGRIQLLHTTSQAETAEDVEEGVLFMQEMTELSKVQAQQSEKNPRTIYFFTEEGNQPTVLNAGPAQFGLDLNGSTKVVGQAVIVEPIRSCQGIKNAKAVKGKIAIVERGDCMFIDKARQLQSIGAIGGIVLDNIPDSNSQNMPMFAMSGDGKSDVSIPMLFLFSNDAQTFLNALKANPIIEVTLAEKYQNGDDKTAQELIPTNSQGEAKEIDVESILSPSSDNKLTETKENFHLKQKELQDNKLVTSKEFLSNIKNTVDQNSEAKVPSNRQQEYLATLHRLLETAMGEKEEIDTNAKQLLYQLTEFMQPKPSHPSSDKATDDSKNTNNAVVSLINTLLYSRIHDNSSGQDETSSSVNERDQSDHSHKDEL